MLHYSESMLRHICRDVSRDTRDALGLPADDAECGLAMLRRDGLAVACWLSARDPNSVDGERTAIVYLA